MVGQKVAETNWTLPLTVAVGTADLTRLVVTGFVPAAATVTPTGV